MEVGERYRPKVPDGVFYDPELEQWACLVCWTPPGHLADTCDALSPTERLCTREPGHVGRHASCGGGVLHHPLEVWEA